MKATAIIATTAAAASLACADAIPPMDKLLPALSYGESRNRDDARGRAGERGRFQFTRYRWMMVSQFRRENGHEVYRFDTDAFDEKKAAIYAEDSLNMILLRYPQTTTLLQLIARWRKPATGDVTAITMQLYRRVRNRLMEEDRSINP